MTDERLAVAAICGALVLDTLALRICVGSKWQASVAAWAALALTAIAIVIAIALAP